MAMIMGRGVLHLSASGSARDVVPSAARQSVRPPATGPGGRAAGPAGGHGMGSSTAVKVAPPKGVEAPAIAAPERHVKLPPAEVAIPAIPALVQEPKAGGMNVSGLNGLTIGGTSGLQTGAFQVVATQPISYTIQETVGLLDLDNETLLRGVFPDSFPSQLAPKPSQEAGQRRFIIMDDNVYRLFGERVEQYFEHHGFEYKILALPTNETNKSFDLVFQVADALEKFGLNRRKEPIIAIGGGVCLDVAGLSANLYRRNTPVIKVPTTLMAAVDASVGIKTAVNFEDKKNKLGTYCPPLAVFLDRSFLRTLDQRNLSNGAAEMLKMACIKDAELFDLLEEHGEDMLISKFQGPIAGQAMRRSVQGMLEELSYNLWEHILCRLVDYGHTFSPEIEMAALSSGNELLHGEAVNIDMALTTEISCNRGLISPAQRDRVYSVMRAFQLPMNHDVCSTRLYMKGLKDTIKARDGYQRLPLMDGIGAAVFVNDLEEHEVDRAAAALGC